MRQACSLLAHAFLALGSSAAGLGQETGTLAEPQQRQAWEGAWRGSLQARGTAKARPVYVVLSLDPLGRVRGGMTLGLQRSPVLGSVDANGKELTLRADFGGSAPIELLLATQDQPGLAAILSNDGEQELFHLSSTSPLVDLLIEPGWVLPQAVPARTREIGLETAQRDALEALFVEEYVNQGAVGLSMAVVLDGKLVDVRHRGWEDLEQGIPVTDATRYRWASISKPLTAVAALQLFEQGQLDLDRDVRGYVPEFPEKPHVITCRQLLCHQGGIVHYSNGRVVPTQREYEEEHPFADAVLTLDRFKESPLIAAPGSRYAYTTHGYLLAGAVVQRAGGAPLDAQVRSRILEPLAMQTTLPDQPWVEIPHRTVGYRGTRIGLATLDMVEDVHWKLAGGGWISTVEDLARFGMGLLSGELLAPETWELMCTSQVPSSGKNPGYGLGIGVRRFAGHEIVNHSGSQSQTATYLLLCPERQLGVFVMCNTRNTSPRTLAQRVARLFLEGQR